VGADICTLGEARAKFSEVIVKARSLGPQTITRNGRKAAVIVAAEEWERKTKPKGNLAEARAQRMEFTVFRFWEVETYVGP